MDQDKAIITINLINQNISHDLEVPLDISVDELCSAFFELYLSSAEGIPKQYYLRSERPIALLKGESSLRKCGIRNGSIINITE